MDPTAPAPEAPIALAITALGQGGDGVAMLGSRRMTVPLALPGDEVLAVPDAKGRARVDRWLRQTQDRPAPSCPDFPRCGGCSAQHMPDSVYRAWKTDFARDAALRAGFPDAPIAELRVSPASSRRRATLAAVRSSAGMVVGFHTRGSHAIVDIAACAILSPALTAVLPALRRALADILAPAERCDLAMTETETGIDLLVLGTPPARRLVGLVDLPGLARLSRANAPDRPPELVAQHRAPRLRFDGLPVDLPPHAFLQATAAGESAIRDAVADGIAGARRIVDLFTGCGTLALPLARRAMVQAFDSDAPAIAALAAAGRAAGFGDRLVAARRDLVRRPLLADELALFDAAIFDPPRDGAVAQAAALAASAVPRIVAVSCNRVSFARDAALLRTGGYRLDRLVPIDQFLWSPHLELVGLFTRPTRRRRP
jgi:23S rRNA (uracil1939-C5)-methyltransferase